MRKLLILIFSVLFYSCTDDNPELSNSELWIKVDDSIKEMTILFTIDQSNVESGSSIYIYYKNGAFEYEVKKALDSQDNKKWSLVYESLSKSSDIQFFCQGKLFQTRGFDNREKRCIEIVSAFDGTYQIVDHDISILENIIYIE